MAERFLQKRHKCTAVCQEERHGYLVTTTTLSMTKEAIWAAYTDWLTQRDMGLFVQEVERVLQYDGTMLSIEGTIMPYYAWAVMGKPIENDGQAS